MNTYHLSASKRQFSQQQHNPAAQILPPDPQTMLLLQKKARKAGWLPRPNLLVLLIALAISLEAVAPDPAKPSVVAGRAAANFYGQIMDEGNRKSLELSEQEPYANALGNREAMKSSWDGICAAAFILDPQIAVYCQAMNEAYFNKAIEPARRYRRQYQERIR